jgi:hypothetical protein
MTHQVPVGLSKKNVSVMVCAAGLAKLQAHAAKVQYRTSQGIVTAGNFWYTDTLVKRVPYVFARFTDPATGRTARPELGKFLLGATLPVAHLNADPLDFRIENLEERATEKQIKRAATAHARREERDKKAAKRAERLTKRKPLPPDGLTPNQQFEKLFDAKFQKHLRRIAGAILRDSLRTGTSQYPTDERRAPEVVSDVTSSVLKRVSEGRVLNLECYVATSVRIQAIKEQGRKWARMGHVRRPKAERMTLSDHEDRRARK